MQDKNYKLMSGNKEINDIDTLTPEDKIKYIHNITMSVVKNSNADKIFKKYYKSKQVVSQLNAGKIILPVNDIDYMSIKVGTMMKSNTYNTYVVEVESYVGSDTYKYMERVSSEL